MEIIIKVNLDNSEIEEKGLSRDSIKKIKNDIDSLISNYCSEQIVYPDSIDIKIGYPPALKN